MEYSFSISYILRFQLHIAASLASSESEAIPESDVTPAGEETLDFDDDTSKGEDSCYYRSRSRFKTLWIFDLFVFRCRCLLVCLLVFLYFFIYLFIMG